MRKLVSLFTALTLLSASTLSLAQETRPADRLFVVMPDGEVEFLALTVDEPTCRQLAKMLNDWAQSPPVTNLTFTYRASRVSS
jgi:hypothetical protein